jgi:hypothetical protein
MNTLLRTGMLIALVWLQLSGISFAKQVYLKNGEVIDCDSFRKSGGQIVVKVNRDIVLEFAPDEVDVPRTFHLPKKVTHKAKHRKPAAVRSAPGTAMTAVSPVNGAAAQPQAVKAASARPVAATPAKQGVISKPAAPPAPAAPAPPPAHPARAASAAHPAPAAPPAPGAAVTAKAPAPPAAAAAAKGATPPYSVSAPPAGPAASPEKAQLERKVRDNAALMAEAMRTKDPVLLKQAMEAKKSLLNPKGGPAVDPKNLKLLMLLGAGLLVLFLLSLVSLWIVFTKAGQAGWKCLIPFYNLYLLMEISGKPGWWFIITMVPVLGFVIFLPAMLSLADKFGKGVLFGIGLFLVPVIFFPVLAFGGARYDASGGEMDFTFSEEVPSPVDDPFQL